MCESPKHIIRCKNLNKSLAADLPENPFASTHSLDANPFDDPPTQHGGGFPNDPHDTRLEQLSQRERDLERREQELNAKAEHIRSHGKNNWPFCESYKHSSPFKLILYIVFPLIYHSISEEIPEASRPLITRLYQLWLVLLGTLIINMIACLFILLAGSSDGGKDLGGSIG